MKIIIDCPVCGKCAEHYFEAIIINKEEKGSSMIAKMKCAICRESFTITATVKGGEKK